MVNEKLEIKIMCWMNNIHFSKLLGHCKAPEVAQIYLLLAWLEN